MRVDECLYYSSLVLQIISGILFLFCFCITGAIIVLGISMLIKGLAWQLANKIIEEQSSSGELAK